MTWKLQNYEVIVPLFHYFLCHLFDRLPQLPVHPSTEYKRTNSLNYAPILFFDVTCHKKQSQTNRYPYIACHSRGRHPLPPYIRLLTIFSLTQPLHSFPIINQRRDKAVPHLYPWWKHTYTDTQSVADPPTNKAVVNNWAIPLAPS